MQTHSSRVWACLNHPYTPQHRALNNTCTDSGDREKLRTIISVIGYACKPLLWWSCMHYEREDPWLLQLDLHRWTGVGTSAQTTQSKSKNSQSNLYILVCKYIYHALIKYPANGRAHIHSLSKHTPYQLPWGPAQERGNAEQVLGAGTHKHNAMHSIPTPPA